MESVTESTVSGCQVWNYTIYGMRIRSEVLLPEMPQADWDGEPDVVVRKSAVGDSEFEAVDTGIFWKTASGRFQIDIENVASYVVRNGQEITVDSEPEACEYQVAIFLLGSVMGALLYQRGLWPLHASAIETSEGAVLFAGRSGTGKSTLAAGLQKRGYSVLSDDISPLKITDTAASVFPAVPRIKLMPDATSHLGIDVSSLRRDNGKGKFLTPVSQFSTRSCSVRHIFLLDLTKQDDCVIRPVSGPEALGLLARATYRRKFMKGLGLHTQHFPRMTALAGMVPMSILHRPRDLSALDRTLDKTEPFLS